MTHDPHDHGHGQHHGHDHPHDHDHHPHDHHHHWESADYAQSWIARDASRTGERTPIIERLIAAVPFPRDAAIAVLDVGGGAGMIAAAVLNAFRRATVTIQDFSPPMLDSARKRLAGQAARVTYVQSDLRDRAWTKTAGGPFDLAVSGIAIHNLHEMAAIAACYEAVHSLLKSGGVFLNYDHFDRVGGVALHQHMLKVAGFASTDVAWHEHPTAVIKANV